MLIDTTRGYTSFGLAKKFEGLNSGGVCHHSRYSFDQSHSISSLDFRALAFYDAHAIWFRDLPPTGTQTGPYVTRDTPDQRTFLVDPMGWPDDQRGFVLKRDIHQAVGGGLRFFLRSVAVPLVGLDAGWGLESRAWRITLLVGA